MPEPTPRVAGTPGVKRLAKRIAVILFALIALLGWWTVVTEGATPARVLTAVAATAAALVEAIAPGRRRLLRRWVRGSRSPQDKNRS